jgi:hypothetical protein
MNTPTTGEIRPNSALSVPARLLHICRELEDVSNAIQPGSLLWFVVDMARQATRVALSDAKLPGASLTASTDSPPNLCGRIDRLLDDLDNVQKSSLHLHDSEDLFDSNSRLSHLLNHLAKAAKHFKLARPYALALDNKAETDSTEAAL